MTPDARARVRCPRCHELVIDLDIAEWMEADRTPDQFSDAVQRLLHAHTDSCTPRPPDYTPVMRRGRHIWRFGAWFPATWFALVATTTLTGLLSVQFAAWHLLACAACLFMAALREKNTYRNGYTRGHFAANHHQPFLDSRWLHPGDGVHDPADKRLEDITHTDHQQTEDDQ